MDSHEHATRRATRPGPNCCLIKQSYKTPAFECNSVARCLEHMGDMHACAVLAVFC